MLASILTSCVFNVPRPEIKTGEFDFSVTYEFNGKQKTISGVYVCEYKGTVWVLDGGYYRDWIGYIKDDKMDEQIKIATAEDGGKIELYLGLYPEYFMGDFIEGIDEIPEPLILVTLVDEEGMTVKNNADDIEETYNAKIISYEYEEPIENTFN